MKCLAGVCAPVIRRRTPAALALAFAASVLAGASRAEQLPAPPTCAAASIENVGATFFDAPINASYAREIAVRVTDAQGHPVADANVHLSRLDAPDQVAQSVHPDIVPLRTQLTTGPDGIARLPVSANDLAGVFQYALRVTTGDCTSTTYVAFHNGGTFSGDRLIPVVEYYNASLRHYFITGDETEMRSLDLGGQWVRTGVLFMALSSGSGVAGTVPVCRFYGRPEAGLDSHFFSAAADECAAVEARFAHAWSLETRNAFEVFMPDRESGACPVGARPVYRAYNNRPDANHRYALNSSVVVGGPFVIDPTWVREGYGRDGVALCVPY